MDFPKLVHVKSWKKNVQRSITYVMCDIFDGVFLQISKHAGSQKNPKVLAESLNWLSDAIKGFGFKYKSMIFLFSYLQLTAGAYQKETAVVHVAC